MNILIVDDKVERQTFYASRIAEVQESHFKSCELEIRLSNSEDYYPKLGDADLVVLGSGLSDRAISIALRIKDFYPEMEILLFNAPSADGQIEVSSFQMALSAGVRKVLSDDAPAIDLLQELLSVYSSLRKRGRVKEATVIVVKSVKGGAGSTTLVAALGQLCSHYGLSSLLWDFDSEGRDLTRGVCATGKEIDKEYERWLEHPASVNRTSLTENIYPLCKDARLLVPPASFEQATELGFSPSGKEVALKVLETARGLYDVIIVDAGPLMSPTLSLLVKHSDRVVLVSGECALGVTAVDTFADYAPSLFQDIHKVSFLFSGPKIKPKVVKREMQGGAAINETLWSLPILKRDPVGERWPGNKTTLYGLGSRETKRTLEEIARRLGLAIPVSADHVNFPMADNDSFLSASRWRSIFAQASEKLVSRFKRTELSDGRKVLVSGALEPDSSVTPFTAQEMKVPTETLADASQNSKMRGATAKRTVKGAKSSALTDQLIPLAPKQRDVGEGENVVEFPAVNGESPFTRTQYKENRTANS